MMKSAHAIGNGGINQYILEPDSYRQTRIIDILIYGKD